MHVKLFVSCINKSYIQSLKTIPKVYLFVFEILSLNLLIIRSIKKIKNQLSEIYIFKYKKLKNEKFSFSSFKIKISEPDSK